MDERQHLLGRYLKDIANNPIGAAGAVFLALLTAVGIGHQIGSAGSSTSDKITQEAQVGQNKTSSDEVVTVAEHSAESLQNSRLAEENKSLNIGLDAAHKALVTVREEMAVISAKLLEREVLGETKDSQISVLTKQVAGLELRLEQNSQLNEQLTLQRMESESTREKRLSELRGLLDVKTKNLEACIDQKGIQAATISDLEGRLNAIETSDCAAEASDSGGVTLLPAVECISTNQRFVITQNTSVENCESAEIITLVGRWTSGNSDSMQVAVRGQDQRMDLGSLEHLSEVCTVQYIRMISDEPKASIEMRFRCG